MKEGKPAPSMQKSAGSPNSGKPPLRRNFIGNSLTDLLHPPNLQPQLLNQRLHLGMTLRRKHIGNLQELPAPRRFLNSALRAPLGMTKRRRPEHIPQQPVGNINMRLPVLLGSIPLQHRRYRHPQLTDPHQVLNHDRGQDGQQESHEVRVAVLPEGHHRQNRRPFNVLCRCAFSVRG